MTDPAPRKAWSISALQAYETCPRRYYEMSVAKNFQDKPSEAMAWGDNVHKAFDRYLTNKDAALPIGMRQFQPILNAFKKQPGEILVEQKLAISDTFNPTTWFGKNVWVRAIADLFIHASEKAILVDWKTGKRKDNVDQLALMAGVMFNHAEELETITAGFYWLTEEKPADAFDKRTFTREELPAIWDRFLPRERAFQEAHRTNNFPPKPSGLCRRYCPVSTCPYHGG